jgi:hypothetical protein
VSRLLATVVAGFLSVAPAAPPHRLFRLTDPRILEASGIARGVASPDVYYVHNDSGDAPRVFAVDARTGAVRAVYRVPGAVNHDWEDIAVAPDAHGTPSLWIADIGDNDAQRPQVQLYRVDEPRVAPGRRRGPAATSRPDVWRLRYPTGPVNAESIAVSPQGRAYLVTKQLAGRSVVYSVPATPDAHRVQTVRRIGSVDPRAATGATISRDGRLLAIRTYFAAYLWRIVHGDVAGALRVAPVVVPLPLQRQGEGICIDGTRLVVDSEGRDQPVWSVPMPAALRPRHAGSPSPAASSRAAPPAEQPRAGPGIGTLAAAAIGAALFVLAGLFTAFRLRRRG